MPNWCSNLLSIPPCPGLSSADVRRVAASLRGPNGVLDFETVLPIPTPLRGIHQGGQRIDGVYRTRWREEKRPDGPTRLLPVTDAELAGLRKRYWADSALDWCTLRWGTKWNALCEGADWTDHSLLFLTAWSPPTGFVQALSSKHPGLRIELRFAEPGCGLNGRDIHLAGEITRSEIYAPDSDAGIENAARVGVVLPEPF